RSSASMVCAVVEGSGTTRAGDDTISWEPKDVFSLPTGAWVRHRAQGKARLFVVSDREVLRRLDLLEEELGGTACSGITMAKSVIETPILIVGGGPIGLALGADLGARGIECLIIEQSDG